MGGREGIALVPLEMGPSLGFVTFQRRKQAHIAVAAVLYQRESLARKGSQTCPLQSQPPEGQRTDGDLFKALGPDRHLIKALNKDKWNTKGPSPLF